MSRKGKSRAQGQTGPAQNETRENVRYDKYNTGKGRGSSATPIYCGNNVIGEVTAAAEFRKHIKGSVHLLRRPRAVAWDISTLKDAEAAGARSVLVIDTETGKEYRAPLSTVWAKGWAFNRGYGDQWGVRLAEMNKGEQPAQLGLFGSAAQ